MRSRDFTRNLEYPQFASDLQWKKADRKEGERERRIESRRRRRCGRKNDGDTGSDEEHIG